MSISKCNSEGYIDLTPYEAITKTEKDIKKGAFRPLVYICSPFSGDIEGNVKRARGYCRFAVDNHCIPLAPHLFFPQFMNDDTERDLAMFMDLVLLSKCLQVWVFGLPSKGMAMEIEKAEKRGQPIRYFSSDMKEVQKK